MNFHFIAQRYWLNYKRHKLTLYVSVPIFAVIMTLIGSIYTGPEMVSTFLGIPAFQALIGQVNVSNSGMLVWFLIFVQIFVLILPAVGIFYGVRMLPFNERDGKELIFSTKMSPLLYFIENFIIVMILIPLTVVPEYLITVIFLGMSPDAFKSMAIANMLPVLFVMVVAMVTVFGGSIKSSTKLGFASGGIFYLIFFALNLIVSEVGNNSLDIGGTHIISLKDLSLMSQMNIIQNALSPTINDHQFIIQQLNIVINYNSYVVTCIALIIILFFSTLFFLYKADYIEPRTSFKESFTRLTHSYGSIKNGFVWFLRTTRLYGPYLSLKKIISRIYVVITAPVSAFSNVIGRKYPAFRDQLKATYGFFIVYTIVTTLLVIVVLLAYPGDENMRLIFTSLSSVIDNPLIAGFMFGHPVSAAANSNLEGFILFKLFTLHWLYYGPFLFIATYYILMRDKSNKYDEVTWSLPKTRSSVIVSRTAAMIVYFWITIFINWLGIPIGYVMLKTYMDVSAPDAVNTLITFFFLALGYSLFLVLFVAVALTVNSKSITIALSSLFIFAIFVPMIADVSKAPWLDYLSPFRYFDVVGLMLKDVNIVGSLIPTITFGGVLVLALYIYSVRVVTPRKDIV